MAHLQNDISHALNTPHPDGQSLSAQNQTRSALSTTAATILLSPLLLSLMTQFAAARTITAYQLYDKMRGMWLGQLIGNAAGRPTEGRYSGPTPNPDTSIPLQTKQVWDADDDTDTEYIALHSLETHGLNCNSHEITQQWLRHIIDSGIYIANKQAWFLMQDGYTPPDTGSRAYNQHWYSIDSQISTEVLGAISPGLPQAAIDLAGKFARTTNTGFPVHAAQFYAAMYAHAFFEPNVVALVRQGLQAIPTTSRSHQVVQDILDWYTQDAADGMLNWRDTRRALYDKYAGAQSLGRYYGWVESTINLGATVLALLYGQGDFKNTIQIAVLAGWDCDCTAATAAGLLGIVHGYSGLPPDLTTPRLCGDIYENVYRPYLPDPNVYLPQYDTITAIAWRIFLLAENNILRNGGHSSGQGPAKTYNIPDSNTVVPESEKPDPSGPSGLVGSALAAGMTVTPTAAVQRLDPSNDRTNLYSIMDGITDNSYNGRRPYYSYTSDPQSRPTRDWYQLAFAHPVIFERLVFYEGDIVWNRINDFYKNDNARGGFFEDLTVEILRDGRYIVPAELQISPALDRYEMYQMITFTFAPTVGEAIRIIGTPGGSERFTTIMELQVEGNLDPGLYVSAVQIAAGQIQRSRMDSLEVEFSRPVSISRKAIVLIGSAGAPIDPNTFDFIYDSKSRRMILFFDTSLPDDSYSLRLDCAAITDTITALPLLDDDSKARDGFYTIQFHKLFGDADGSATVDFLDLALFTLYWLNGPDSTGLDSNADGVLNHLDLAAFAHNWLTSSRI